MKYREKEIVHFKQPDLHTCGPTCIKMALEYLNYKTSNVYDIISNYNFEVKYLTGAPFFRMEQILVNNNINFDTTIDPGLINLKYELKSNVVILSVLINFDDTIIFGKGYKHWVVVYDYDNKTDLYYISDPLLGKYKLNLNKLILATQSRNFLYIKISINNTFINHDYKLDNIYNIIHDKKMKLVHDANFLFNLKGIEYNEKIDLNYSDYVYSLNYINDDYHDFAKNNFETLFIKMNNIDIINKMKKYSILTSNRSR